MTLYYYIDDFRSRPPQVLIRLIQCPHTTDDIYRSSAMHATTHSRIRYMKADARDDFELMMIFGQVQR